MSSYATQVGRVDGRRSSQYLDRYDFDDGGDSLVCPSGSLTPSPMTGRGEANTLPGPNALASLSGCLLTHTIPISKPLPGSHFFCYTMKVTSDPSLFDVGLGGRLAKVGKAGFPFLSIGLTIRRVSVEVSVISVDAQCFSM
jgi:hypothetical protein